MHSSWKFGGNYSQNTSCSTTPATFQGIYLAYALSHPPSPTSTPFLLIFLRKKTIDDSLEYNSDETQFWL